MKKSDAVKYFGKLYRIWKEMNKAGHKISLQAVYQWRENIPHDQAKKLHEISGGILDK
jgi:hypothetical protein